MSERIEIKGRYVRYALRKAADRNEWFEEANWNQHRPNAELDNFVGVMGELGFAEYADLQIDADIYETSDGNIDFVVMLDGERTTIDVKTRRKRPSRLWVKEKSINADLYVLGHLLKPENPEEFEGWEVEFFGTARRADLLQATRVESDCGWMNRSIWLDDLDPLPEPSDIEPLD